MLLYLVIAIVAIWSKRFMSVIIWVASLQVLAIFIYASSGAINGVGIIISFFVKVFLGSFLYWMFKKKEKILPLEEFKKLRKGVTIVFCFLFFVVICLYAWMFFQEVDRGKNLIDEAKTLVLQDAPLESTVSSETQKNTDSENGFNGAEGALKNSWNYNSLDGEKTAYIRKIEMLQALVRAVGKNPNDMHEMCVLMSIGSDVNAQYLNSNPNDTEEQKRGMIMADQLSICLAGLHLMNKTK